MSKVLIVEDEKHLADGLRFNLEAEGYEVEIAANGAGDRVEKLTLMEADLLRFLVRHEGKTVSRRNILEEVWGLHEDTDTRAIDNFIARLRKLIEDEPATPCHLLTVRGVGYRFVANPD